MSNGGIPPVGISPLREANLKSAQGIEIMINYHINHSHAQGVENYQAESLYFNVIGTPPQINSRSTVQIVLINRYFVNNTYDRQKVLLTRLSWIESIGKNITFDNNLNTPIDAKQDSTDGHFTVCHPQIALVVDSVWQQDPWQWPGAHNFNFAWQIGDEFN
jgi:hypothetical protein